MDEGRFEAMGRYAFVVCASDDYIPGVKALLASIEEHAPYADIVFGAWDFPPELVVGCRVIDLSGVSGNRVRGTAVERFRICSDISSEYDSICLLDADMFLLSDPRIFFEIASHGHTVTGHNGMIIDFNAAYQDKFEIDLGSSSYPYFKTHTSVPIFISSYDTDWFGTLYELRDKPYWDDFLHLNILGISLGKNEHMLSMPAYTFTGIHHWQLKPDTAARIRGNKIVSGTEEEIYMVHGKWWDQGWLDDLDRTMERYHDIENMGNKCREHTRHAKEILHGKFKAYCGD